MTPKKSDKLVPLWSQFEKSGSIQHYLKYHKAKLASESGAVVLGKAKAAKRKKAAA